MLTDSGNALNAVAVRTAPDEVYKLDPNYWRESVSSRPLLFLELFSPTCGHCKALEPEFIAANKTIELNGFTDIMISENKHIPLKCQMHMNAHPDPTDTPLTR